MAKIILTENTLKDIIKESVKGLLSELNWKTKQSYADKRLARGEHEKAREGRRAAVDAFNAEYGVQQMPIDHCDDFTDYNDMTLAHDKNGRPIRQFNYYTIDGSDNANKVFYNVPIHKAQKTTITHKTNRPNTIQEPNDLKPRNTNLTPGDYDEYYAYDEDGSTSWEDGNKEIDRYNRGKYIYSKDKGWHLKNESIDRIVKENINNLLKHHIKK